MNSAVTHDGLRKLPPVPTGFDAFDIWRTGVMTGPMIDLEGPGLACVTWVTRAVVLLRVGVTASGFGGVAGSDGTRRGAESVSDCQRCPGVGPGGRDGPASCPAFVLVFVPALAPAIPPTPSFALALGLEP